ncbi:MAG: hypothetical protein GX619_04485 [Bacteroidales bacterium]|jgi:hypothetical protein|nr:hypothetical protein [Bacteroidales bacterium]OPZ96271.1 MAG: hypothetical protein BWY72_01731 [Bacteroidetes bacterium ADurb.Bin416]
MKKILTVVALCFALAATAVAQEKGIGLRFNGGYDNGAEVSYQQNMGDANRLEADLGFGAYGGFALTGIYHWVFKLEDVTEGLAWYVGPGAGLRINSNGFGAGIVGQIGIEYTLPTAPIQFSLDSRPGVIFGNAGYNDFGAAFSIRYRF